MYANIHGIYARTRHWLIANLQKKKKKKKIIIKKRIYKDIL